MTGRKIRPTPKAEPQQQKADVTDLSHVGPGLQFAYRPGFDKMRVKHLPPGTMIERKFLDPRPADPNVHLELPFELHDADGNEICFKEKYFDAIFARAVAARQGRPRTSTVRLSTEEDLDARELRFTKHEVPAHVMEGCESREQSVEVGRAEDDSVTPVDEDSIFSALSTASRYSSMAVSSATTGGRSKERPSEFVMYETQRQSAHVPHGATAAEPAPLAPVQGHVRDDGVIEVSVEDSVYSAPSTYSTVVRDTVGSHKGGATRPSASSFTIYQTDRKSAAVRPSTFTESHAGCPTGAQNPIPIPRRTTTGEGKRPTVSFADEAVEDKPRPTPYPRLHLQKQQAVPSCGESDANSTPCSTDSRPSHVSERPSAQSDIFTMGTAPSVAATSMARSEVLSCKHQSVVEEDEGSLVLEVSDNTPEHHAPPTTPPRPPIAPTTASPPPGGVRTTATQQHQPHRQSVMNSVRITMNSWRPSTAEGVEPRRTFMSVGRTTGGRSTADVLLATYSQPLQDKLLHVGERATEIEALFDAMNPTVRFEAAAPRVAVGSEVDFGIDSVGPLHITAFLTTPNVFTATAAGNGNNKSVFIVYKWRSSEVAETVRCKEFNYAVIPGVYVYGAAFSDAAFTIVLAPPRTLQVVDLPSFLEEHEQGPSLVARAVTVLLSQLATRRMLHCGLQGVENSVVACIKDSGAMELIAVHCDDAIDTVMAPHATKFVVPTRNDSAPLSFTVDIADAMSWLSEQPWYRYLDGEVARALDTLRGTTPVSQRVLKMKLDTVSRLIARRYQDT